MSKRRESQTAHPTSPHLVTLFETARETPKNGDWNDLGPGALLTESFSKQVGQTGAGSREKDRKRPECALSQNRDDVRLTGLLTIEKGIERALALKNSTLVQTVQMSLRVLVTMQILGRCVFAI